MGTENHPTYQHNCGTTWILNVLYGVILITLCVLFTVAYVYQQKQMDRLERKVNHVQTLLKATDSVLHSDVKSIHSDVKSINALTDLLERHNGLLKTDFTDNRPFADRHEKKKNQKRVPRQLLDFPGETRSKTAEETGHQTAAAFQRTYEGLTSLRQDLFTLSDR